MVVLPWRLVCGRMVGHHPGAQTERRERCRAGGGLLGGKDPAGRFSFSQFVVRGPRVVMTDRLHYLDGAALFSANGATSNVRSSLQSVQVPLTRARTFQR
jgi:hypothetical protein